MAHSNSSVPGDTRVMEGKRLTPEGSPLPHFGVVVESEPGRSHRHELYPRAMALNLVNYLFRGSASLSGLGWP